MGVFTRYIEELQSYEILLNYFREAAYNVRLRVADLLPRCPCSQQRLTCCFVETTRFGFGEVISQLQ
jgi:hypothetical protein